MLKRGDTIRDKDGNPLVTILVVPVRGAPILATHFLLPNGKTPDPHEQMHPAVIEALKNAFDPD